VERNGRNIYSTLKVLIFSLSALNFACTARAVQSKSTPVDIRPVSCEIANIELSKIDMLFKIQVINNSEKDIQITSMTYEFSINDHFASSGNFIDRPARVRAKSRRTLEKFIPVPEEAQIESVKLALRERKGTYKLKIKYAFDNEEYREKTLTLPIKQLYQ